MICVCVFSAILGDYLSVCSDLFLKNFLAANPAKSMYGFTLNRKRPGHFSLCFLANKKAMVQTWVSSPYSRPSFRPRLIYIQPVRVAPEAYYLFDAAAVGVPELCDAFKVRHAHEAAAATTAAAGGKTPYGAGLRTPARPLGGATPGHMSVRQVGRTPNPYGAPSGYGAPPPTTFGYQTPAHRPPNMPPGQPMPPSGIPPRPMVHQSSNSGWGQGGSGW